jgi:hypothetical protein
MDGYEDIRANTPHSFVSVSTFLSHSPSPTPEPCGLSPRPSVHNVSSIITNGSRYSSLSAPKVDTVHARRLRALSGTSAISNTTWWSAVASVTAEDLIELSSNQDKSTNSVRKSDSGVALQDMQEQQPPVPLIWRDSKQKENGSTHKRKGSSDTIVMSSSRLPRHSRSTSTSDTQMAKNNFHSSVPPTRGWLSDPASTIADSIDCYEQSRCSTSAIRQTARPSGTILRHNNTPQPSSSEWQQWSWDSAKAIAEVRRRKRREIEESLNHCSGRYALDSDESTFSAIPSSPLSATHVMPTGPERTAFSMVEPTTIAWKNLDSLRAEYAAVDRQKRSAWEWVRRRLLCGASILGCSGSKEFWEEGDEDRGSVRRYRLQLPECRFREKVPFRARSVEDMNGGSKWAMVAPQAQTDIRQGARERWSTMGVWEGISPTFTQESTENIIGN